MPMNEFPRRRVVALLALATQVLERHPVDAAPELLARDLLDGFPDLCNLAGLDGILDGRAVEEPAVLAALAARLGDKAAFDPRGPRSSAPQQLADAVLAVLGLTVVDPPD